jgi:enolase
MVIKITQVGTMTEAIEAIEYCRQHNYNIHPCGSRGDRSSIADVALGFGAGQVRAFDWRRMRELEQELGDEADWPGKELFKTGPGR